MKNILIVGGGVAGLTAAIELEKAGHSTTILERSDRIGGRVKTDVVNGLPLDHGFQVMLTQYPAVKRYLNSTALDLKLFSPGALIFTKKCSMEDRRSASRPFLPFSHLVFRGRKLAGQIQDPGAIQRIKKNKPGNDLFRAGNDHP